MASAGFRVILRAAAFLALGAGIACTDPTGLRATEPTLTSVVSVYAMTGTPTGFPSALSVPDSRAVRLDGTLFFDLAFDLDEDGRAVIYPMELVAWNSLEIHRVGLLQVDGVFADLERAPATGYVYDEAVTLEEGDVLVVESNDVRACGFNYIVPRQYAKIGIEAIDTEARSVRIRMTLNPNCGFRSFLAGIPNN